MRFLLYISAILIPGSGHALQGRYLRGFLLMFTAFAGLNIAILGNAFFSDDTASKMFNVGIGIYAVCSIVGLIGLLIHMTTHDPRKLEPIMTAHLANATKYYLQGKYDEAEAELTAMLRRDPDDIEARIYLASVYRAKGDNAKAKAEYNKALAMDESGKWSWQVLREMKELE